ncbi:MAG TPA: ATP-grasp domain-containing protein, partial [Saccharofermentans sp.]|nr:ATP-grasp domain-containing protein [Saccharofermentans sp.]
QVSTTDKEATLQVALKERINGIVAYASDPAAPTAAYVGNKLGLPSNPYESVLTLCRKDLFRRFLKENGFNTPKGESFTSIGDALDFFHECGHKVIVKPVDSSGSKGVRIVDNDKDLIAAFEKAFETSREKTIVIEEVVENKHRFIMGGDGFIVDGNLKVSCLMNCHRDTICNPLVPVGKSFPPVFRTQELDTANNEIQRALLKLRMEQGAVNLEAIVDPSGKTYIIEIGPRNGGNLIPEQTKLITGIDMIDLTIKSAMGMSLGQIPEVRSSKIIASHVIHSRIDGILKGIEFSDYLQSKIIHKLIYKKNGDRVEKFNGANQALGIIMMEFSTVEEMFDTLDNIYERHLKLEVE